MSSNTSSAASPVAAVKRKSRAAIVWRRLRKSKAAMVSMVIMLIIILLAVFADKIYDYDADIVDPNYAASLQPPSPEHWLGTDEFGRDLLARMIYGARVSLRVGLIAVSIACVIGTTIGAIAGYFGGAVDNIIMRAVDIFMAVPSILMSITIVAAFGTSMFNLMVAIGISSVPGYARQVRAAVMGVKDMEFVEAAKSIGESNMTIIFKEILPNCLAPIIVRVTMGIAGGILSTSSLSFLGLGVQPPAPEWGAMLSSGRQYLRRAPYLCTYPGLAILIVVMALNFIGDALRDALDPRLKQ